MDPAKYERIPYVLYSELDSNLAASGTTQMEDSDLRNDSGYDFEVCKAGLYVTASTPALEDISIRVSDLSRNIMWMKDYVRCAVLVDGGLAASAAASQNMWFLCRTTVLPANSNLRVEVQNNDATDAHGFGIAFHGHLLVPVQPGTRFDEAVEHAERARP